MEEYQDWGDPLLKDCLFTDYYYHLAPGAKTPEELPDDFDGFGGIQAANNGGFPPFDDDMNMIPTSTIYGEATNNTRSQSLSRSQQQQEGVKRCKRGGGSHHLPSPTTPSTQQNQPTATASSSSAASIIKQEYDDSVLSPNEPHTVVHEHQNQHRQPKRSAAGVNEPTVLCYGRSSSISGCNNIFGSKEQNGDSSAFVLSQQNIPHAATSYTDSNVLNGETGNLNGQPIITTTAESKGKVKVLQKSRNGSLESANGRMMNRPPRLLIAALPSASLKLIRQQQQQQQQQQQPKQQLQQQQLHAQIVIDRMEASPSPPSSGDGSSPETPSATTFGPLRNRSKMHELAIQQRLITEQDPKGNGDVSLSAEERRTLMQEGYSVPSKLPLNKQEEESLKIVRRKIKNKLSAQESRRKRKEYTETLEQRLQNYHSENAHLRQRIKQLEAGNRSLGGQLKKLHQQATLASSDGDTDTGNNNNSIDNNIFTFNIDNNSDSNNNNNNNSNTGASNPASIASQTTSVCLTALIVLFAICMPTLPTGLFPLVEQQRPPPSMVILSPLQHPNHHPNIIQNSQTSASSSSSSPNNFLDKKDDDPQNSHHPQNIVNDHKDEGFERKESHHRERDSDSILFSSITNGPSRVMLSSCEKPANIFISPNHQPTVPSAAGGRWEDFDDAITTKQHYYYFAPPIHRKHAAMADVRNEQDELLSIWLADSRISSIHSIHQHPDGRIIHQQTNTDQDGSSLTKERNGNMSHTSSSIPPPPPTAA